MNARPIRRTSAVLLTGGLVAGALIAAPAALTTAAHAEDAAACEITGGTLTWGVKESFRSYISGTIANGEWETSDGAKYETPDFIWSDPTGSIDPATGEGSVSFTGTLHFTGHDGVLDLTLANPTIEVEGDGSAALLLDAKSTDMEGEVSLDAEQVWVGDIASGADTAVTDGKLTLADLPVVLTNEGVEGFAGFYEAGVELDPITLDLEVADCDAEPQIADEAVADEAADAGTAAEPAAPTAAQTSSIPWLPIGIGGAALFVIGLTLGLLIGGRKPKAAAAPAAAAGEPAPDAQPDHRLFGEDGQQGGPQA